MFENIIGNEKVKEILTKSIKIEKTSHSYLFIGTNGIGKKMIAKEFAKMLLCLTKEEKCNNCSSCIKLDSNNNPDFFIIEPEEGKVKIDQIRNMQKKVSEKPIISNHKVYIIDDANTMTTEAQNCLLKTLEEPPKYVTIILIGNNESDFLSTIKSRCTIIHFNPIDNKDIKKYLQENYKLEDIDENMINIFGGSIKKAIELKDKKDLYINIDKIIKNLDKSDIIDIFKLSEDIYKAKEDIFGILEYMNFLLLKLSQKDYKYANCINIIEETKKRLKAKSNYNMSIDYMLFNIWGEVNEKHSWS